MLWIFFFFNFIDCKSLWGEVTVSTLEPNISSETTGTELTCDSTLNQVTFTFRLDTKSVLTVFFVCLFNVMSFLDLKPDFFFFFLGWKAHVWWRHYCVQQTAYAAQNVYDGPQSANLALVNVSTQPQVHWVYNTWSVALFGDWYVDRQYIEFVCCIISLNLLQICIENEWSDLAPLL